MPGLTRRRLLAGIAAVTAPVVAGGVPAAVASAASSDAALVALWQDFAAALETLHAAERQHSVCESRYLDEGPDIPAELRRGGPLGKLLDCDWDWWHAADLRDLLKDRTRRKHWPTARELLAVARAYAAADRRFARTCGLKAAEAAQEAAMDALGAVADQMLATPAQTLAGLAVKARAVKAWGRPELTSDDPGHGDPTDRLVAQVLEGVVGMAESGRELTPYA